MLFKDIVHAIWRIESWIDINKACAFHVHSIILLDVTHSSLFLSFIYTPTCFVIQVPMIIMVTVTIC